LLHYGVLVDRYLFTLVPVITWAEAAQLILVHATVVVDLADSTYSIFRQQHVVILKPTTINKQYR
jgi:hypothetical protein